MSESTGPAYAEGTSPAYNEATPYPFKPDGQPRMYTNGRDHMVILDERSGFRIATPAEIAAAHPKCNTCDHRAWAGTNWYICNTKPSPYHAQMVDLGKDYCPHHTELTGESDE